MNQQKQSAKSRRLKILVIICILYILILSISFYYNRDIILDNLEQAPIIYNKPLNQQVNDLNNQLLEQEEKYNNISVLQKISEKRKKVMLQLIKNNPDQFLENSIFSDSKSKFPSQIQENIEEKISFEGQLKILTWDNFEENTSGIDYFLEKSGGERYNLFFAGQTPEMTGQTLVKINGIKLDDNIAVNALSEDSFKILQSFSTTTVGQRKVGVVLYNFASDNSQPFNTDYARDMVFIDNYPVDLSVDHFYQQNSFNKLELISHQRPDGDIFGWYTVAADPSICQLNVWIDQVKEAASDDGVNLNNYDSVIYASNISGECIGGGYAEANGGSIYILGSNNFNLRIIAHELGHNLGLGHASSYSCTDTEGNKVTLSDNCDKRTYGDDYDIMAGKTKHMNASFKGRLGWFAPENYTEVTQDGIYTIHPLELSSDQTQVLKVPRLRKSDGTILQYYYLEYRQPIGYDFDLYGTVINGVSFRLAPEWNTYYDTILLDMDPSTYNDDALIPGKSFTDPNLGIVFRTLSASAESVQIEIIVGSNNCIKRGPSLNVSPRGSTVPPGTQVIYTLQIRNNDSSACPSSIYGIQVDIELQDRLTADFRQKDITILPGETRGQILIIGSYHDATEGLKNIDIYVTDNNYPELEAYARIYYIVKLSLIISKTGSTAIARAGDTITFTLTLKNFSFTETLYNIRVLDHLNSRYTYIEGSATENGVYDPASRNLNWEFVQLTPQEQKEINYQVLIN